MTTNGSKPFDCLICGSPISNTNLGIDACRACAMFYRRHSNDAETLLCRKGTDDCTDKKMCPMCHLLPSARSFIIRCEWTSTSAAERPLCRKCRYARFAAALSQSSTLIDAPSTSSGSKDSGSDSSGYSSHDSPEDHRNSSFIDHRSFDLFASCSRDAPFFDRMKRAYSMLCVVRLCGEEGLIDQGPENGVKRDEMMFYPVSHAVKAPSLRILSRALITFFESVFDDYNALSRESKKYIMDKSALLINSLDVIYRAVHHFPDEEVITPTYISYVKNDLVEQYVENYAEHNKADILKEMKNMFTRNIAMIRSDYMRINPSNDEFLAMMGLSLWNNDASRLNDDYMDIVSANRSAILSELHKLYASQGITDYSARLGDILCLLESIEKNARQTEEDMATIQLMSSIKKL